MGNFPQNGIRPNNIAAKAIGGAAAFEAGLLIGTVANGLFFHIGLDDGSAPSGGEDSFCYSAACGAGLNWYPQGSTVYYGATVRQSPGAYLYSARLNGSNVMYSPVRWFELPCQFSGFTPPPGGSLDAGQAAGVNCVYDVGQQTEIKVDYPYVPAPDILARDSASVQPG